MIVVGLTGSLASGKSQAAEVFKKLGAKILDADQAARKLTKKGTPLYKAIVKIFGTGFLGKNRELDRRRLAWHVFARRRELKKLNILIHPGVIMQAYKEIEKQKDKKGLLVLDVPLLFESRMEKLVDVTVVVKSDVSKILERAERKGVPRELARKILATQWPVSKKAKLADYVVDNNGSPAELETQIRKIYGELNPF